MHQVLEGTRDSDPRDDRASYMNLRLGCCTPPMVQSETSHVLLRPFRNILVIHGESKTHAYLQPQLVSRACLRPAMFSSVGHPKTRAAQPKNNFPMQAPRGFSVRVFKGPTLSTFPYTATAKFDVGYRPTQNTDPRQAQNWYCARPDPSQQPLSNIREPPKASRFSSWTEPRSRDPNPGQSYAIYPGASKDTFVYERSLSSKSDIYSENDTASTGTCTPSSIFSPALSADSTLTSGPSEIQSPTSSSSTPTSSVRHPFPLHIPALAQAQSAIRGLFVIPNADAGPSNPSPTPVPSAPPSRTSALPDMAGSPPRFLPSDGPGRPTSPMRQQMSASPEQMYVSATDYFPPPASESEVGAAHRLAERNAQYNSASSMYYQAGLVDTRAQSPQFPEQHAPLGSTARSVASSSFPTESSDARNAARVYETSSIGTNPATLNAGAEPSVASRAYMPPVNPAPTLSQPRVSFVASESSSTTVVESEDQRRDTQARSVPVSHQLIELESPFIDSGDRGREGGRYGPVERVDPGRYEELRGLNISPHAGRTGAGETRDNDRTFISSDRQRESYLNAFASAPQSSLDSVRPWQCLRCPPS
ncbi:hypothetical protein B0H10DRAFT_358211 [Mycena sp. CBHHK59/15]|nr:hypothetical protein B0H10DRAFT_358211 [Mycena sp. CBHHK59/15]